MSEINRKKHEVTVIIVAVLIAGLANLVALTREVTAGTPVGGHISSDTAWTLSGSPYWVIQDVIVDPNATLTIEAGVNVLFQPGTGLLVRGSLVTGTGWYGGVPTLFSANATQPYQGWWGGIEVDYSGLAQIRYSEIYYAHFGVWISGSPGYTIENSTIAYSRLVGIGISGTSGSVKNNTIRDNGQAGLMINASLDLVVEDNNILNNSYGILFSSQWGNLALIRRNIIDSNKYYGVHLRGAPVDFFCNRVSNNRFGISVDYATNVVAIHHNNVMYNGYQARDYGPLYWDNGTEGNYWSDYNGTDVNGDGIGDQPYIIDTDSQDRYPFMNPVDYCPIAPPVEDRTPPTITNLQPPDSSTTNDSTLTIGADYSDSSGIDTSSVVLKVDSIDVTSLAIVTASGVRYRPPTPLSDGVHNVYLEVGDTKGNLATVRWSFTVGAVAPPTNLWAELEGPSLENISLTWNLSADDGSGQNDVSGYDLYYSTSYDREGFGYVLLASLPPGTSSYLHLGAGHGNINNYFYSLVAKDDGGNVAKSNQAGKFTKFLASGKQLISIPLIQSNTSIDRVLGTVDYDIARYYSNQAGHGHNWLLHDKRRPWGSPWNLDHTMALWVNVVSDSYLTVAGKVAPTVRILLKVGWNFVGYPSFVDRTVAEALAGITHQTVEGFDPSEAPYYLKRMVDNDVFAAGNGYWIHISGEEAIWTLQN